MTVRGIGGTTSGTAFWLADGSSADLVRSRRRPREACCVLGLSHRVHRLRSLHLAHKWGDSVKMDWPSFLTAIPFGTLLGVVLALGAVIWFSRWKK